MVVGTVGVVVWLEPYTKQIETNNMTTQWRFTDWGLKLQPKEKDHGNKAE
jgi:hypothetical protein